MANIIELTSSIEQSPDQVSCDLDGETVLMSIENGMYYGMDTTGSRIWQLIEGSNSIREICTALTQEYDVEARQCEQEVLAFVKELQQEGLVILRPN